ncbi:hypothetical protein ES705_25639 [subsurface metagenome]
MNLKEKAPRGEGQKKELIPMNRTEGNKIPTYYQLIPEKILQHLPDIESLIRPQIKGFSSDNLKEIISIIAYNIRKNEEGSAPLKITFIKKLVPQGDKYLLALIDLGIVTRSGNYIPGEISYRYNFSTEYQSKYIHTKLRNQKLVCRVRGVYDEKNKEVRKQVRSQIN